MSYEGFELHICAKGHLSRAHDFYSVVVPEDHCPVCHERIRYYCAVDVTNGFEEEDCAGSWEGTVRDLGFEDEWRTDHYGNRYAIKVPLVEPDPDSKNPWHEIAEPSASDDEGDS